MPSISRHAVFEFVCHYYGIVIIDRVDMARPKNTTPTDRLVLSATPQLRDHLKALVKMGLYGKTPSEVALNLVCRSVETLIKDGILDVNSDR